MVKYQFGLNVILNMRVSARINYRNVWKATQFNKC